MKWFAIVAALALCSSARAATYVHETNAYQGYTERGRYFLPFLLTITIWKPLRLSSILIVPLKTSP